MKKNFLHTMFCTLNRAAKKPKLQVLLLVFLSYAAFSQFTIKPNTVVSLDHKVVSLEKLNTLNTSLKGSGVFFLRGNNQQLHVGPKVAVSNLHIVNANGFEVLTPMLVSGDVILENGVLDLQYRLFIQGKLHLLGNASILNDHFLEVFSRNFLESEGLGMQTQRILIIDLFKTLDTTKIMERVGKSPISFKNYLQAQYQSAPNLPPPEQCA